MINWIEIIILMEDGERWHGSLFIYADSTAFSIALVISAAGDTGTVYHAK